MKNSTYLRLFISALTLLFLFSCKNNIAISDSQEINGGIWGINQAIKLEAKLNNPQKDYNLFINVNVKDDFLTNNLWLFMSTKSPSGNVQTDTLMFYVTDEKGKWFGNKSGSIIKNKFLYKSNIKFPEVGVYTFQIKHGMRETDLPKVVSVGISIENYK